MEEETDRYIIATLTQTGYEALQRFIQDSGGKPSYWISNILHTGGHPIIYNGIEIKMGKPAEGSPSRKDFLKDLGELLEQNG